MSSVRRMGARRYDTTDVLRGISILLVIVLHSLGLGYAGC